MKTSGDHRWRQREKAPDMAANDHIGSWVREVLPHWAEPLWANTFRGRGEAGRRWSRIQGEGKDRGGEQRSKREEEKIEFKVARSGEPDSMPRLATEGKKVGEARKEVVREKKRRRGEGK